MHVLVTSDTLSGTWTYTRELVSGLVSRGMRVTLVSFGEIPLPQQTLWMENLHGLEYRPTAFRLDWMEEGQQDLKESSAYLTALVKELKPDRASPEPVVLRQSSGSGAARGGSAWRPDHMVEGGARPGAQAGPLAAVVSGSGHARSGDGQCRRGSFGLDAGHRPRLLYPGRSTKPSSTTDAIRFSSTPTWARMIRCWR